MPYFRFLIIILFESLLIDLGTLFVEDACLVAALLIGLMLISSSLSLSDEFDDVSVSESESDTSESVSESDEKVSSLSSSESDLLEGFLAKVRVELNWCVLV